MKLLYLFQDSALIAMCRKNVVRVSLPGGKVERMISQMYLVGALCCLTVFPGFPQATSLMKIIRNEASGLAGAGSAASAVSIDPARAHTILPQSRPRRNADPGWNHNAPDFQAYYRYYNSIGHTEGLYEIDRMRMMYQQMQHLERVNGPKSSPYLKSLGGPVNKCNPSKDKKCKAPPPPHTAPTAPPPPLSQADVVYLCNSKDPLCKPHIVYLPTGAVPVLCDPRYHPACKPKTGKETHALSTPPPPLPPKSRPNQQLSPAPIVYQSMEHDCDPYWDPDCLIDHPYSPIKGNPAPLATIEKDEVDEEEAEDDGLPVQPQPFHDRGKVFFPHDYRRDLFDPYVYSNPAPDPQ
ncbi:actinodin3 isoform X1 [Scleropages formosus]|uniref:actinodin3 isoform X1 n=1 Tax=Scleropages formosus TaxID=113540 RepID=UPI0008784B4E|nr:extensin-2-like isoform X1 [Scleropages formosus]